MARYRLRRRVQPPERPLSAQDAAMLDWLRTGKVSPELAKLASDGGFLVPDDGAMETLLASIAEGFMNENRDLSR